jgi:hypothetical protein
MSMDPPIADASLPDVLESTRAVVDAARYVHIDEEALQSLAARLQLDPRLGGDVDEAVPFIGTRAESANFVLLMDALNFCFWSPEPWELIHWGRSWTRTHAMVAGLLRAVEGERAWLEAKRWAEASRDDIDAMFRGRGRIPLIEKRLAVVRETGAILTRHYGGESVRMVDAVAGRARPLARLLAETFPSFRDVAVYEGRAVALLKRAQICVADLHRLWVARNQGELNDLDALTLFADYRLPQLLRHVGVLQLDASLADRIDREQLIEAGSAEEIELRAATIWAGKLLGEALSQVGRMVPAWRLDYLLWIMSKAPEVTTPHHRTLTIFY